MTLYVCTHPDRAGVEVVRVRKKNLKKYPGAKKSATNHATMTFPRFAWTRLIRTQGERGGGWMAAQKKLKKIEKEAMLSQRLRGADGSEVTIFQAK